MKKENGFTLVETIVALFIGMLMLTAIYTVVNSAQRSSSGIERRVIAQQDARASLELMAMEIRMASYNPQLTADIWVSTTDCSNTATNQTYRGIQEATATSLSIEMDINDNGVIDDTNNNANETIKYVYNSTNQYITRSTNCGVAHPFLGAAGGTSTVVKTVNVVNTPQVITALNPVIPVFRYYDGAGAPIAAPVTAEIPNIRRIEITLVVETETGDINTTGDINANTKKIIIYSTSVIPRNHIPVPTYAY